MKILMIAPEPFFEPRGTPFSEYFRIKALTELGHQIDLATYPIGKDIEMAGLSIHRSLPVPGIRKVKVGPSIGKLFLDFFLFFTVLKLLIKNRYDCIHTHEEACFMGAVLCKLWRIPHVYDMHSSLSQQFSNFEVVHAGWVHRILRYFENLALKYSDAIIAICPYLDQHVKTAGINRQVFVIENTPEADSFFANRPLDETRIRKEKGWTEKSIILYAGTFEPYQGLDLLLESVKTVTQAVPNAIFLLIGGDEIYLQKYKQMVQEFGIQDRVLLLKKVPVEEMNEYFALADVVVSPRKSGTNTPLKIYSYLRCGKPIVATDLITHTQVLNPQIAILTEPNPAAFAAGIIQALKDASVPQMVERARQTAEEKYSYQEYIRKTSNLYSYVESLRKPNQYLKDKATESLPP
jgi:glycosyltransferase involved in cell wall biosynthesis